ncbi:MAG: ComEA family DNA-binding protein [Kofleriaceae bacterium]
MINLDRLRPLRRVIPLAAVIAMVFAMGGTWVTIANASPPTATAAAEPERPPKKSTNLVGKLNLNTASEQQLMLLPTVGPAKAERVIAWRKKNGGFRRVADLRRVKGFGYKTFKRLEPLIDIRGETTLTPK